MAASSVTSQRAKALRAAQARYNEREQAEIHAVQPVKVANLHAMNNEELESSGRRDRAITGATHQMVAIFGMLIVCVQHDRSEIPKWPFDSEIMSDVIRSLAIRGQDLNNAVIDARSDEISTDELEGLVSQGLVPHG